MNLYERLIKILTEAVIKHQQEESISLCKKRLDIISFPSIHVNDKKKGV